MWTTLLTGRDDRQSHATLGSLWGGAGDGPGRASRAAALPGRGADRPRSRAGSPTPRGWAAISMKRVAEDFGVTAMALYRYVEGKDDLSLVMMEMGQRRAGDSVTVRLAAEPDGEVVHGTTGSLLMGHPWMLQVPLSAALRRRRGQLAWMEAAVGRPGGRPG